MATTIGRLDPQRALKLFADWTDRIAAGELPAAKPPRPQGSRAQRRRHAVGLGRAQALSARQDRDRPAQSDGQRQRPDLRRDRGTRPTSFPMLDPVNHTATTIQDAGARSQDAVAQGRIRMAPSPYWGEEPIWDSQTSMHNPMYRREGPRVVHLARRRRRTIRPSARRARTIRRRRCSRSNTLDAAALRCTIRRPARSR